MFKRNPLLIVHLNSDTGIPPIPVFDKKFMVGRKPTHLVSIPDNSISRDHIEVIFQDGQLFIMDMGTSNGTTIGGQPAPANIPAPYQQGKIITLGKSNVHIAIEIFEEDREKRKNNPSLKAIQQLNSSSYSSFPNEHSQVTYMPSPTAHPMTNHQAAHAHQPTQVVHNPAPPPSAQLPMAPRNESSVNHHPDHPTSQQMREDANRILAKAKIEAEIAAKGLLKNKEGEAQKLVIQAEIKAQEKIKEAESRVQDLLHQAQTEVQKVREEKLEEAKKEKNHLLAQVLTEKELIVKDIDALKQTIPSLSSQIDQLKVQIQKFHAEKSIAETQQTQELIKLEKAQAEVKNQDLQLQAMLQQLDMVQKKVQEAEAKYKQTLSANQTLVDDTKNALEKAKARESELQSLVETAKKETESAMKYASEQRSDADSYSKVMKEEADLYAKTLRDNTELWEKNFRETTEREVKTKWEHVQKENEQMALERDKAFHAAKEKQESLLEELRATEALKLKNLHDIDAILKQKTEDFEASFVTKQTQMEREFSHRQKQIETELHAQREAIERELTERRTSIERELLERREILERESAEKRVQIENEAQELRTLRDKEYKELKMQQDSYLLDIKKREEDRLKAMIEDSKKMIHEQFEQKKENAQKGFAEFFAGYTNMAPPAIKEHLPELQQQLSALLKDILLSEKYSEDKQLKQLFEYDPDLESKHKKFWIRFAVAASIVLTIVGYVLYNPKSISTGAESITEIVNILDEESKKKHSARMEQMKKASIYSPIKDDLFKNTYTDNILYTNRYLEFEHDDEYRSQWIVAIKEYLIQEAKLLDDTADEILSKEGTLIITLSSENIDGLRPEKGIDRMNDKESEFNQYLTQYLKPEKRKILMEKKQAFYERFINDSTKSRVPATNSR